MEWLELMGTDSCREDTSAGKMAAPIGCSHADAVAAWRAHAVRINAGGFTIYGRVAHFRTVSGDALLDRRDDGMGDDVVLHVRRLTLDPSPRRGATPRDRVCVSPTGSAVGDAAAVASVATYSEAPDDDAVEDGWIRLDAARGADAALELPMAALASATNSFSSRMRLVRSEASGQSSIFHCALSLPRREVDGAAAVGEGAAASKEAVTSAAQLCRRTVVVKRIVAHPVTGCVG